MFELGWRGRNFATYGACSHVLLTRWLEAEPGATWQCTKTFSVRYISVSAIVSSEWFEVKNFPTDCFSSLRVCLLPGEDCGVFLATVDGATRKARHHIWTRDDERVFLDSPKNN